MQDIGYQILDIGNFTRLGFVEQLYSIGADRNNSPQNRRNSNQGDNYPFGCETTAASRKDAHCRKLANSNCNSAD
jgi:hypothetical protein